MSSLIHKSLRHAVLGLMMILACASTCYCDSYDPDPYDDTPPVIIELNYVVPVAVNTQISTRCFRSDFKLMSRTEASIDALIGPAALQLVKTPAKPGLHSEKIITPLRT
ncbi:MAG: hypothetical protein LAP21_25440 [Acidobacteriia bacterium]|nr:hypothetical protein [Terriglobia bacterium]